jgi:hypothetical protein
MSPLLHSRAPSPALPETESKLKQTLNKLEQAQSLLEPALRLGKAGVTGIGIPGVEGVVNGVVELAEMVSVSTSKQSLNLNLEMLSGWTDHARKQKGSSEAQETSG